MQIRSTNGSPPISITKPFSPTLSYLLLNKNIFKALFSLVVRPICDRHLFISRWCSNKVHRANQWMVDCRIWWRRECSYWFHYRFAATVVCNVFITFNCKHMYVLIFMLHRDHLWKWSTAPYGLLLLVAFAEYILMQASEEYMPFMNLMKEKTAMSKVLFVIHLLEINLGLSEKKLVKI